MTLVQIILSGIDISASKDPAAYGPGDGPGRVGRECVRGEAPGDGGSGCEHGWEYGNGVRLRGYGYGQGPGSGECHTSTQFKHVIIKLQEHQ